jgi:uncharacterized protein YjbJ (UPF0337 family)
MNKDRIAGTVKKVTGRAKELVGESLGDAKTAADGRKAKYEGRAQAAAGHIKDAVREIASKK